MKDIVTPVPPEEVRGMIKKSLETAALVNYSKLSVEAKVEGAMSLNLWTMSANLILSIFRRLTRRNYCTTQQKIGRLDTSS